MKALLVFAAALSAPLAASAAPCPASSPFAEFEGHRPLQAIETATLEPGGVARVQLKSEAGGFGGTAPIRIARAGIYAAALSARAWIDLVRDGRAVPTTGHEHGTCGGIVKIVRFRLEPGDYQIKLSRSPDALITFDLAGPQ